MSKGELANAGALLAGRDLRVTAAKLTNTAGVLEAGQDLLIEADEVRNQRGPVISRYTNWGDYQPPGSVNCRSDHGYCESWQQIESTPAAILSAARNLSVRARALTNDASLITAGVAIDIQADTFDNVARTLTTTWHGHWREWRGWLRGYQDHDDWGLTVSGGTPAVVESAGELFIHATTQTNSGVLRAQSLYLGGDSLTNGLTDYRYQTPAALTPPPEIRPRVPPVGAVASPDPHYLFASGARLALLMPSEETAHPYWLDPLLENRWLMQVAADYGFGGHSLLRERLLAQGQAFAKAEGLALGVALSEAQRARLAEPILWYVEETVPGPDGTPSTALVPRLYLPEVGRQTLAHWAWGSIEGGRLLWQGREVRNTGVMAAEAVSIEAKRLANEKRSASVGEIRRYGEGGYWRITGDTVQPGGFITAARLKLAVERIDSLSGEFYEDGQERSGVLAERLGEGFHFQPNRDHLQTEWVQTRKQRGLEQVAVMAVALAASVITYGAASEALFWSMAESSLFAGASIGTLEVAAAAGAGAAAAMAGNATAQVLATGRLDAGNVLRSGLSGAFAGSVNGYFGESWSFERVVANSLTGGVSSELNGGQFQEGFKMNFLTSLARYGWDYTRQATDALKRLACASGGYPCLLDERGQLRTDGARDVDWSLNAGREGNWLTRSGMAEEGSGQHWYDPGGPLENRYLRYFVTDVSKMHDWFNSWSYNPVNGFYMSRGTTFDSLFQLYSFAGMPVAGVLTAVGYLAQPPYSQMIIAKPLRKSQ